MDTTIVEVRITCGSVDEAAAVAGALVERHLAACVHEHPIRSTYRWEGRIEHDDEILLSATTTAARVDEIRELVAATHSYDVPALVVVAVTDGTDSYLDWVRDETAR